MESVNNEIYTVSHISMSEDEHKILEKQRNNKSKKTATKKISGKFHCNVTDIIDNQIQKLIIMSIKNKKILEQKELDPYNNQKQNHSPKRLINKLKLTPFQIYQKSKDHYLKQKMDNIFQNTNQINNDYLSLDESILLDKHLKFLQYKKKQKLNKLILTNYNPFKTSKDKKIFKNKKLHKNVKNYLLINKTRNNFDVSKITEIRNINANNFSNINNNNYCSIFSNDKIKKHISFFEDPNFNLKNVNSSQNFSKQNNIKPYNNKSFSFDHSKVDKSKLPKIIDRKIRCAYISLYDIIGKNINVIKK